MTPEVERAIENALTARWSRIVLEIVRRPDWADEIARRLASDLVPATVGLDGRVAFQLKEDDQDDSRR